MSELVEQRIPIHNSELDEKSKTINKNRFQPIMDLTRKRPKPPSFRRTAARYIEPATGASTWALGSHMWTINIGNFTKNPVISAIVTKIWTLLNLAPNLT